MNKAKLKLGIFLRVEPNEKGSMNVGTVLGGELSKVGKSPWRGKVHEGEKSMEGKSPR